MTSKPPQPQTPAPPAQASGADAAKVAEEARRKQQSAWNFADTIIAPRAGLSAMPAGTKSTFA